MKGSQPIPVNPHERRERQRSRDDDAFWAGYRAGRRGLPSAPAPAGFDDIDWLAGWIEGDAERRLSKV